MTVKEESNTSPITLTARWDHDTVPLGVDATRGLLIDVEVDDIARETTDRPPVNLALVIDRSGSMSGAPLAAAREAAIGVAHFLRDGDRLSVAIYDNQVDLIVDALNMDAEGKATAQAQISQVTARGSTNLAEGWLTGARAAARAMDNHGFSAGHVVLLSDGCANAGECNPTRLAELAGDLADRNVTTTCVGIGAHYSLLQMTAIAEAGQGEIHQSNEPEEIVEVLAGEIGEQTRLVARNFTLHVDGLPHGKVQQLTHYRDCGNEHQWTLGNLVAGQTRQLALLVDLDADFHDFPGEIPIKIQARWDTIGDEPTRDWTGTHTTINFVDPENYNPEARDKAVAETLAKLWMARQGYEAMRFNEMGDFVAAEKVYSNHDAAFENLVDGLDNAACMLSARTTIRERTSRHWDGLSKKEAMLASRKAVRGKDDFRRQRAARNQRQGREGADWMDVV